MDGRITAANRLVSVLPYTSLLGVAVLMATIALGFEEPHVGLLVLSAALLASAPVGLVVHLASTAELTVAEKRLWLRGLTGRDWARLVPAYFRPEQRHSTTSRLVRSAARQP